MTDRMTREDAAMDRMFAEEDRQAAHDIAMEVACDVPLAAIRDRSDAVMACVIAASRRFHPGDVEHRNVIARRAARRWTRSGWRV